MRISEDKNQTQKSMYIPWFLSSGLYGSCVGAQLATARRTGGTCIVCGHPTMSNYLTMYSTINSRSSSSSLPAITATSYYKIDVYCLWP